MTDFRHERPSWADPSLTVCGFTLRGESGPDSLLNRTQVHGAEVHIVDSIFSSRDSSLSLAQALPTGPAEGDGLWTTRRGLNVAVRVADCVPILLYDPGLPAVAAVHAGWRGTVAGITAAAVEVGERELGVSRERLRAAIGPAIGPCCFEVGPEVVEGLRGLSLSDGEMGLIPGPRGRPHVDLRASNRTLLERSGLAPQHIELVGGCTYCDSDRYESYRRDGARAGRMRGVIGLALLVLALLAVGCTPSSESAFDMAGSMSAAARLLEGGDGGGAEGLLRAILVQRPEAALAHGQLARAFHLQGRDREAVVAGRIALGLDPQLWEAAYNLACHHTALGEYDAAIRWLQLAILLGDIEVSEVVADLDLLPLRDDHRFAFYESSGVLSRAEEDVLVLPGRRVASVGEATTVSVLVIALNRPLMSERLTVDLELLADWPSGSVRPLARTETFSTGESGGLEYSQRSFQFTFVPQQTGFLALGPFRVTQGSSVHYTGTRLLEVRPGTLEGAADLGGELSIADFFRAPSQVDGELALGLSTTTGRFERFRAPAADVLPEGVVPDPEARFRSVFLQRGTEGLSHLLELR
jgi:YfiH family protein